MVASHILSKAIPGLLDATRSSIPEERQSHGLEAFSELLIGLGAEKSNFPGKDVVNPWKDALLALIISALERPLSRRAAILLIVDSLELEDLWSLGEISSLIDQVNEYINEDDLR